MKRGNRSYVGGVKACHAAPTADADRCDHKRGTTLGQAANDVAHGARAGHGAFHACGFPRSCPTNLCANNGTRKYVAQRHYRILIHYVPVPLGFSSDRGDRQVPTRRPARPSSCSRAVRDCALLSRTDHTRGDAALRLGRLSRGSLQCWGLGSGRPLAPQAEDITSASRPSPDRVGNTAGENCDTCLEAAHCLQKATAASRIVRQTLSPDAYRKRALR